MRIDKIQEKINDLLNSLTEAGFRAELDIRLPVDAHVEFFHDLRSRSRGSVGSGGFGSDPTDQLKFRYPTGDVTLLRPDPSSSRPHMMMSEAEVVRKPMNKPMKKPEPKKEEPKPNLDALVFQADMERL